MGILMSLLRIVFGVIVGIGIFIGISFGLGFLFSHFPGITACILLCLIGILLVWNIVYSLKSGKMVVGARWGGVQFTRWNQSSFGFIFCFLDFLPFVHFMEVFTASFTCKSEFMSRCDII